MPHERQPRRNPPVRILEIEMRFKDDRDVEDFLEVMQEGVLGSTGGEVNEGLISIRVLSDKKVEGNEVGVAA